MTDFFKDFIVTSIGKWLHKLKLKLNIDMDWAEFYGEQNKKTME